MSTLEIIFLVICGGVVAFWWLALLVSTIGMIVEGIKDSLKGE